VSRLELKIPPAAIVLVTALLMWVLSRWLPFGIFVVPGRIVLAIIIAGMGGSTIALAVVAFRRANTTVNPTKPGSTSYLVRSSVYNRTRNPMYVGFLLILFAWAIFLASAPALLLIPVFIIYMNFFQIRPEERALAARFGREFESYTAQVRRWI
jgi:protein-S-isoprenylcysteine O-methyltransferase Ste14